MFRLTVASTVALVLAQAPSIPASEVLTLREAVARAIENNRGLQNAALQLERAESGISATRTRRLPSFDLQVRAGKLVSPVKVEFPGGAFGEYPVVGPIPAVDTIIESPTDPAGYVVATVSQPLSQLHRIGLGVRMSELSRDLDREKLRSAKLSVVSGVKELYYSMLRVQSSLEASRQQLDLYREVDRIVVQYVSQETALKADGLDAKAQLAAEEYRSLSLENALAAQKEQMNDLLGRDVRTVFESVAPVEPASLEEMDLDAAQARALERRAEIRQARLQVELADADRRYKKAEFIPDVGVGFNYTSFVNAQLLPQNVAMLAVELKWEPFDWGRKSSELASKTRAVDQAKNAATDVANRVLMEVAGNFRKVAEARTLLGVRTLSRDSASEKLRVALNRNREQAALVEDLLTAQANLARSNAEYQEALMSLWTARVELEKSVGEESPDLDLGQRGETRFATNEEK
jgi:outer membrane protein TolC